MSKAWVQTRTGLAFDLLEPTPDMVEAMDIAWSLSLINRFNGHSRYPYSVAQHCVLLCDHFLHRAKPDLALAALLHDAGEAYLGDVATPVKGLLPEYKGLADRVDRVIAERFGVDVALLHHPYVKRADAEILFTEMIELLEAPPRPWAFVDVVPLDVRVEPWPWTYARDSYLNRLQSLGNDR